MAVHINCKSDEDSIINEIAIVWTTFSKVYVALKGGLLSCQWLKVGHYQTLSRFYACPCICKLDEDLIRTEVAIIRTRFSLLYV